MSGTFNDYYSFGAQVIDLESNLPELPLDSNFLSVNPKKDGLTIEGLIPPEKDQSSELIIRNRSKTNEFSVFIATIPKFSIQPMGVIKLLYDEGNWWLIE